MSSPLPPTLASRFAVVERMRTIGAEADLFVVRGDDGRQCVLKLYRHGIAVEPSLLARVAAADLEHVVHIEDHGRADGHWYEVQEHVTAGSLADLFELEGPRLPERLVRDIVQELNDAISHLHERELWHRDIKPSNILVRTREPRLDLVLTDFGLAVLAVASEAYASTSRTPAYAAPEAQWNRVGPFRDYWSLGMIVLEAISGTMPFAGESEFVIGRRLAEAEPFDLSGVPDERWRLLVEGLLTWDADQRWGAAEVAAWLEGESPPVHRTAPRGARAPVPYEMPSGPCHTPAELAAAMAADWEEGRDRWGRGWLTDWLERRGTDHNLLNRVLRVAEGDDPIDVQMFELLLLLDPARDPNYLGLTLDPRRLAELCGRAIDGDERAREVVVDLRVNDLLGRHAAITDDPVSRHLAAALPAEVARYDAAVAGAAVEDVPSGLRARAVERILAALAEPQVLDQLVDQAVAVSTPEARARGWFAELGDPFAAEPGTLAAIVQLGPVAAAQTRGEQVEQRTAEDARRRQQVADHEREQAAVTQASALVAGRRRRARGHARWAAILVAGTVLLLPDAFDGAPRAGTVVLYLLLAVVGGLVLRGLRLTYPEGPDERHRTVGTRSWEVLATLLAVTLALAATGGVLAELDGGPAAGLAALATTATAQARALPVAFVLLLVLSQLTQLTVAARLVAVALAPTIVGLLVGRAFGAPSWWTARVVQEGLALLQRPVFEEVPPLVLAAGASLAAVLLVRTMRGAMRPAGAP